MKPFFLAFAALFLLLVIAACGAATKATTSTPVVIVVTATFTPTLEATPTPEPTATPTVPPTPEGLVGEVPQDWTRMEVPGTEVAFAIPDNWQTDNSEPGLVYFRPKPSPPNSYGAAKSFSLINYGAVQVVEQTPATKLSLLRLITDSVPLFERFTITVLGGHPNPSFSRDGEFDNPPMTWAQYGADNHLVIGGVVTDKGTVLLGLNSDNGTSAQRLELLEQMARTLDFPAPVEKVEN